MGQPVVVFEGVSKKFRRGERHTSLRDLLPSLVKYAVGVRRRTEALAQDEFWALQDISFEVEAGSALGIIGANGAGKSTTLKILTRILRPTTGRSATVGRVGALIEVASGFHPDLTGRENVFLQGAIMGMRRAEIVRQFDRIVDFAGLEEYMDTPVKRYSSGMNARLGFSIAAHLEPQVLIIDEVLSVGDMAFQQKCYDRMDEFKRQGVAIVLVSHNLQAVATLCDRALYLHHRVVSIGDSATVIDQYVKNAWSGGSTTGSDYLTVTGCELTDAAGQQRERVAPGTLMRVRLSLQPLRDLTDLTYFFRVRRSTDSLLAYDGNVTSHEASCDVLKKGDAAVVDFDFAANLTRGHYFIELHIFHEGSHTFILHLSPAASFIIEEMRTHAGIADLRLDVHAHAGCSQDA